MEEWLLRVIDESQEWRNGDLEYQTSRRNGGMVTQSNKRVVGMEDRTIPTIRLPVTECSNGYFTVVKDTLHPASNTKPNIMGYTVKFGI